MYSLKKLHGQIIFQNILVNMGQKSYNIDIKNKEGEQMYLIVGLGNPGKEYENTRHNTGFEVVNQIASKCGIGINTSKFNGKYGTGTIEGNKVILLEPQTYMNLSGKCIKKFVDFYKLSTEQVIVIYDDVDIDMGKIRIRKEGGPGTHNGMKSIVHELQTEKFPRIRVGIGMPKLDMDLMYHVLGKVRDDEKDIYMEGIDKAVKAVEKALAQGIDIAMNLYN